MSFEKKLQSLRKASNISQEELANELGVSRQAVSKWESGVSYPEMDKLILMTKIFNCTLDDLVNDDVTDSSIMKQEDSKGQNYIDSLLEFITKTINMFTSMKFSNVIKCLVELLFLVCILYLVTTGIYYMVKGIIFSIFPVSYGRTLYYILYFIGAVFLFVLVALDLVIFFQFYKIRYLDYYDKLIYQYQQEKNEKINRENEEVQEKEVKKEIIKEDKRETIIIRDPDHRPLAFLSTISNAVILLVKIFVLCWSVPFIISLMGLIIAIVLSIYLIFTNFIFFGITLAIIGAIVINVELLIVLYDFIFKKKVFVKWLFVTFIISIFVSSIGVGLALISFKNIDVIEMNQDHEKVAQETYAYNDELYFNISHYASDTIYVVDNSLKDTVNVEIKYLDDYYDIDLVLEDNVVDFNYNSSYSYSSKELIDKFLKDLKNNKFEIYYGNSPYEITTITSSEENIKNLIKNLSKEENIKVLKSRINDKVVYNIYTFYTDNDFDSKRVCELNDFYYDCVNVHVSYEIEPNFKYEYKDGRLIYDEDKYLCRYDNYEKTYNCSIRY